MATAEKHTFPFISRQHVSEIEDTDYFGDHSSELVRIVLFFFIVLAGTGIWSCVQCINPFVIEGGNISMYKYPGKMLLLSGALVLATAIVSIVEAGKLTRVATVCMIRALGCTFFIETIAGSHAAALSSAVSAGLFNRSLLEGLKESYSRDKFVAWTLTDIQKRYRCCGVLAPEDWINSSWHHKTIMEDTEDMEYPASCCEEDVLCNSTAVHNEGCGFKVSNALYRRLQWTYICAFSCVLIHVTCLLMLSFLESKL